MGLIEWLLARVPNDYSPVWTTYLTLASLLCLQLAWLLRRFPFPRLRSLLWLWAVAVLLTPVTIAESGASSRWLPAVTTLPLAIIRNNSADLADSLRVLQLSLAAVLLVWTFSQLAVAWYRIRSTALSRAAVLAGAPPRYTASGRRRLLVSERRRLPVSERRRRRRRGSSNQLRLRWN